MKSNKMLLGVLAGAAVGALLSTLKTSDKAAKIRKEIIDLGDEYASRVNKKFTELSKSEQVKV